jgi:hypothetical protein
MCKFKIKVGDKVRIDNLPVHTTTGHIRSITATPSSHVGVFGKVLSVQNGLGEEYGKNYYAFVKHCGRGWRPSHYYFFDDLTVIRRVRRDKK